jgi:phosphorylase superfamily protein
VPKVILGADEKKAAASRTGAAVVDMEADAVAVAARARGLGFLSVKVVIDTPSEPLASTYAGCWTVLKDVLLRPGTIMQMVYDSKRVKVAAERLKDFFVALKEKLPVDTG